MIYDIWMWALVVLAIWVAFPLVISVLALVWFGIVSLYEWLHGRFTARPGDDRRWARWRAHRTLRAARRLVLEDRGQPIRPEARAAILAKLQEDAARGVRPEKQELDPEVVRRLREISQQNAPVPRPWYVRLRLIGPALAALKRWAAGE
ncbi:MAG: hypothetical protein P8Y71_14420 [Pseudolabrys sp.]